MNLRHLLFPALTACMILPVFSGCFTGIESTPKISEKEVRRQTTPATPEQEFSVNLRPAAFGEWHSGRQFRVADSRISLVLDGHTYLTEGDTLVYLRIGQVPSVTGDSASILYFLRKSLPEIRVSYRVDAPLRNLMERESFTLPFTVDLNIVAYADSLLRGRRLYLLSPLWVSRDGNPTDGLRYIPVTVDGVVAGNDRYPLQVNFTTTDGSEAGVLMTLESTGLSTRNFADIFTFSDPRLRYPTITDEVWKNIIRGDLAAGMTREECRLSVGMPRDVKKGHNGSYYYERWTFDNGAYLIFEDGVLAEFRK